MSRQSRTDRYRVVNFSWILTLDVGDAKTVASPIYLQGTIPYILMDRGFENTIRRIVSEELTRSDVRNIFDSRMEDYIKEKEFKKAVRAMAVDVLEDFFNEMWRKKGMWKSSLKGN